MTHLPIAADLLAPMRYLTRHMLIAGATGTGKTTTAAAIIERLSIAGVPCLVLDAKGDLESLSIGTGGVWDSTGERGTIRRCDLAEMGPDLIARALDLSDAQAGALEIAFVYAETYGLPMHSLDDLKQVLSDVVANRATVSEEIGLVTPASVAAVQRALLRLNRAAPYAFGKPALDPRDAAERTEVGRGHVTVMRCAPLTEASGLYGAIVAHMLETLYRGCGELGDVDSPAMAMLIDEAHLVFDGASPAIIRRIEKIVRLIRSKGIALIFATQSPSDLPAAISGQLATRIQHGLRGATQNQLKQIRAAADSMPIERGFRAFEAIRGLGIGQALVSVPSTGGVPSVARVVNILRGDVETRPLRGDELKPEREKPRDFYPTPPMAVAAVITDLPWSPDPASGFPDAEPTKTPKPWYTKTWAIWLMIGLGLHTLNYVLS